VDESKWYEKRRRGEKEKEMGRSLDGEGRRSKTENSQREEEKETQRETERKRWPQRDTSRSIERDEIKKENTNEKEAEDDGPTLSAGAPWDELTTLNAARFGHLDVLQWAYEQVNQRKDTKRREERGGTGVGNNVLFSPCSSPCFSHLISPFLSTLSFAPLSPSVERRRVSCSCLFRAARGPLRRPLRLSITASAMSTNGFSSTDVQISIKMTISQG
jgi:hypothetical protein